MTRLYFLSFKELLDHLSLCYFATFSPNYSSNHLITSSVRPMSVILGSRIEPDVQPGNAPAGSVEP